MLNKLEKLRQFFINKEFVLVILGGTFFFSLKFLFMLLNDTIKFLPVTVAYLVCHAILFSISWVYHKSVSFHKHTKNQNGQFMRYTKVASLFKIADYFLVIGLTLTFNMQSFYAVIVASAIIFLIRFALLKSYVFR